MRDGVKGLAKAVLVEWGPKDTAGEVAMDSGEARFATTIYEIGLLAQEKEDLPSILQSILQRIIDETGATWVGVGILDQERNQFRHLCSIDSRGVRFPDEWFHAANLGVVGEVIRTGEPICIDDVRKIDFYEEVVVGIRSEAAVPLRVADHVMGVLNVESKEIAAFGPNVMALLQAVSTPLALTIQNARLFDEQRRRADQLAMLQAVSTILTSTVDCDELLKRTAKCIREQLDYEMVAIGLVEGHEVELKAVDTRENAELAEGFRQRIGIGVTGEVVSTGKSFLISDVEKHENYTAVLDNIRCEMCCPLRVGDKVFGFLDVESSQVDDFDTEDLAVLQMVADHISQAIENASNLEKLNDFRQDLVAMVVHDLRNPLTTIQTTLDLLSVQLDALQSGSSLAGTFPIKSIRRYLLNGQSAGQEMLVLINGLLDLQKMEAGAFDLRRQPCGSGDLARSVARRVQVIAEARHIALNIEADENAPAMYCDMDLFSRVLENLLSNALKYTPEGGTVTIVARRAPEDVVRERLKESQEAALFAVEDTGPGIPREDRERVFEKFAVVELRRRAGKKISTGLGLAFCRHAVKSHGGAIWIDDRQKPGSRICVLVPTGRPIKAG